MFQTQVYEGNSSDQYELVIKQLDALLSEEKNVIANLSNAGALLNQFLENINWVGFYILEENELILGPFQGLPACVRIPLQKGVCGTAAGEEKTILVEDVHQFPGHIACDPASRSEIVIPVYQSGNLFGVLDIDSPKTNRFDETDRIYLEKFVQTLEKHI